MVQGPSFEQLDQLHLYKEGTFFNCRYVNSVHKNGHNTACETDWELVIIFL